MATRTRIDLNADVGEGPPGARDRELMREISSASIACGGHAGGAETMRTTLELALELGLRVGAHPSYPDRDGFGRVSMSLPAGVLRASLEEQVGRLLETAAVVGARVAYIKPHGALYNDAARDPELLALLFDLSRQTGLPLMHLARIASPLTPDTPPGLIREGFIDRTYSADGYLLPRLQPGALILDPAVASAQAVRLAPEVDSLCVHSDTPSAPDLLRAARRALKEAGMEIGH